MRKFTRGRLFSFKYAFSGLRYVIVSQRNAWIHAVFTLLVVVLAALLELTLQDWGILLLAIGLVWTAENLQHGVGSFGGPGQPAAAPAGENRQGRQRSGSTGQRNFQRPYRPGDFSPASGEGIGKVNPIKAAWRKVWHPLHSEL
jgi:hypothetical protein